MVPLQRDRHAAEARAIVDAVRRLQASPELLAESRIDLPAALDRLGLTGTARHAVASTLALTIGAGVFVFPGSSIFWSI
jgi:hypothetical protein